MSIPKKSLPGWEENTQAAKISAVYDYRDESGGLLYQAVRFEPKAFRQRRPDGSRGFTWELNGTRRVLYQLPEILNAKITEASIYIVEGEKDAETLKGHSFTATCNPMGAGKWRDEYSECLKGFLEAILIADKDDPGRKHAQQVAASISRFVERIKILELPGEKIKDATDWFESGGTPREFVNLVNSAPLWKPIESTNLTNPDSYNSSNSYFSSTSREPALPAALSEDAFHGLAGEIVKALDPFTEADPAAMLTNLLVMVGNVVGARPHFKVNGDLHGLKIFMVHVGASSRGRKGSSLGQPKRFIAYHDPKWVDQRIQSGLSTGEGLIWAVHDPVYQKQPIKEKKSGRVIDYQKVMIDEGIDDKRILATEEEFSRTLKAMSRDGNTLSAVIRAAWDSGNLQTLTRGTPYRATGAHVSIIAHITKDELLRHFESTEAANGFGNRFLWVIVNRSKLLPKGKSPDPDILRPLQTELSRRLNFASTLDEITRSDAAERYWEDIYSTLSEEKPGLFDALTARATPQVMRLACIYAILDRSPLVEVVHLRAALSVWRRVEESIRFIWGDRLGDPIADEIIAALRVEGPKTLTQIHEIFKRNQSSERIRVALSLLSRFRLAQCGKSEKGAEVWSLVQPGQSASPVGLDGRRVDA